MLNVKFLNITRRKLQSVMDRIFGHDKGRKPRIFTSKFLGRRHAVRRPFPDNNPVVMDYLKIENNDVFNHLGSLDLIFLLYLEVISDQISYYKNVRMYIITCPKAPPFMLFLFAGSTFWCTLVPSIHFFFDRLLVLYVNF